MFTIICQSGKLVDPIFSRKLQKRIVLEFANLESMNLYSQHFLLNAQGASVTISGFWISTLTTATLCIDVENGGCRE